VDPDEALTIMRDEISSSPYQRLSAALALDGWITRGGFRPSGVTDTELATTIAELRHSIDTIRRAFSGKRHEEAS